MGKKKDSGKDKKEKEDPIWLSEEKDKEYTTEIEQEKIKDEKTPLLAPKESEKKSYDAPLEKPKVDVEQPLIPKPEKQEMTPQTASQGGSGGSGGPSEEEDDESTTCTFTKFCSNIFKLISTFAVLVHLAMLAAQILPGIFIDIDNLEITLRVYICIFLLACICIEMEWLFKNSLVSNFIARGIIYSFLGLIGMEQGIAVRVDMLHLDHVASAAAQFASLFLQITSWIETCLGYFYIVMGLFCMKAMRDNVRAKEKERLEILKEMKQSRAVPRGG